MVSGSRLRGQVDDLLELGDGVDLRSHRDIGHAFRNDFDDDRDPQRFAFAPCPCDRIGDLLRLEDAHGAAAERVGGLDVIDAVFADFGRVDVLGGELDLVVHLEGALRLTDQPEIGVVDEHHHERHSVLRRDGQFLDQELEGVVAGDADDLFVRIGELRASAGRDLPAQRPGLAADDVIARP